MIIIESHTIPPKSTRNLPENPNLRFYARKNRRAGILAEVLFWKQVQNGKFYGINFNRQKVIGNYIVDFYVPSLSLVIEIDGCSHNYKEDYDLKRENYFRSFGLKIFKAADRDVKQNLSWVLDNLRDFIILEYLPRSSAEGGV
ncbi:MAG: endonuclease domain-containing protein [Lentimicrobiaceae bacterium]|nr:endonuclease domain-containing protein [Lentimicrobiaceae bacterium]